MKRTCTQCGDMFDPVGEEAVCPSCLAKLYEGRFGYRKMTSGPLLGKYPIFDHKEARVLGYAKDEDSALGSVLLLDTLESIGLLDAKL